ncbi:MAG: NFACT RNA binding domain-containing protein [Candidatus Nanoarchaeia archaeon]
MELEIELEKNVEANAQKYFEKAKKSRKKLEGAKKALEETRKKLEKEEKNFEEEEQQKEKKKHEKARKKEWYEKFRWFKSSNDFLIIGGKDATSNEIVIKKHTDPSDIVYHTEAPGSPFIVIKNPEKRTIQETTKKEAAVFAATFSKAWEKGTKRAEVFEVKPEQVTKEAKAGEYVAKGAFVIQGQKKFYDTEIDLAIGYLLDEEGCKVIMSGPETAVAKHCKEYIKLKQGDSKKGEISKLIMKKFGLATNDDILGALPAGEFSVKK